MPGELTDDGLEKLKQEHLKKGLKLKSFWQKEVPVFRGRYRSSITVEAVDERTLLVGTNLDYARDLEFGLGEGEWPDVDELKNWVGRKINPLDKNLDETTFLIGRKIFREGVNRNPSLQRAVRKFKTSEA